MAGEAGMGGIATVAPPESVIGTPVCMTSAPNTMAVTSAHRSQHGFAVGVDVTMPDMTSLSPAGRDGGRVRLMSSVGAVFMVGPGRASAHHLEHR